MSDSKGESDGARGEVSPNTPPRFQPSDANTLFSDLDKLTHGVQQYMYNQQWNLKFRSPESNNIFAEKP